ncbi:MAG: hypothetical protein NC131_00445 [Roseburia sp.]|nr:hypothetical protein [Roseburia sp.]
MQNNIPQGITIIYFNDESKNIYAKLPPDREQAKELSKRIYKNAMTALSAEQADKPLTPCG